MTSEHSDPIASADAAVTAIDPGLRAPGVHSRDVVLVTGPWLAGATGVIAALRRQLPERTFVEADELAPAEAPAAVVFVVSAIAPMAESDCVLVDMVCDHTDLVIGVVSKIDAHRTWRAVLAADRTLLAAHAPRYEGMPWVGVAANPDLGEPDCGELVELLRRVLDDGAMKRRNRLRSWEARLEATMDRCRADAAGADREASALREQRDGIRRERRLSKTERSVALRSHIQQARVQLTYFARNRTASVRAELQEDIAGMSRRRIGEFETYVRRRAGEVVGEVDEGITAHLLDVATGLGLSAPPAAPDTPGTPGIAARPVTARRLEARLMMVLGAGFGFGVALAVSRLFAGLAPGLTAAGLIAGGAVGLLLTVWVVGIRGLLHDRAVLDRWVGEVTAALRASVEELVATRVLAAEASLTSELAVLDEAEGAAAAQRVAQIDVELRALAIEAAQATALCERRLSPLQRVLDEVRAELRDGRTEPAGKADERSTAASFDN